MTGGCRHELFTYGADTALAAFAVPYLDEGRRHGDALLAVYVADKLAPLRDALGPAVDAVAFVDADEVYTHPAAAVGRYDATIRGFLHAGAPSIRVIGELPPRETQAQWDAWMLYEALLNRAFEHFPLQLVCTIDERLVPEAVLHASRQAHPHEWRDGALKDSPHYRDPVETVRSLTPAPRPLPEMRALPAGVDSRGFRARLSGELSSAGVSSRRASGMLLAASEIFANVLIHGDGAPMLRVGVLEDEFVCELADRGSGLDDPLAGYLPPREGARDSAGLWVARQLAARLELLPTPGGGLTARLWA